MATNPELNQPDGEHSSFLRTHMAYYGGATTIEYPDELKSEFDYEPRQLSPAEPSQAEEIEDQPAEQPNLQLVESEIPEAERQPRFGRISFDRLPFSGIKRALESARELPSAVGRAVSANLTTNLASLGEKITLAEHKTARRRISFAALGTVALAGAAYAVSKGIHVPASTHHHEVAQQALPVRTPHHAAEVIQPRTPIVPAAVVHAPAHRIAVSEHHHVVHRAAAHVKYHTEVLKFRGDTIWNHVQERVQAKYGHISQSRLTELTNKFTHKTLSLNHLSSADARHMSLGQKFKISL